MENKKKRALHKANDVVTTEPRADFDSSSLSLSLSFSLIFSRFLCTLIASVQTI